MNPMKPDILLLLDRTKEEIGRVGESYTVHYAPTPAQRSSVIERDGALFRAVITSGTIGLTAAEIDQMPNLQIICCGGVGFDGVDTAHARKRGIAVTHGPGTNNSSVADHTAGLLLSIVRGIPEWDRGVREGLWTEMRWNRPTVAGKKLGILGLGSVGSLVAQRLSGFEMEIFYHNRRRREDVPYEWVDSPVELARKVDFLVTTLPGGAGTHRIVDAAVLDALGAGGYLVNVGRGSLVDTDALVVALREKRIAGAALDVVEGEPGAPEALRSLPNVVITPHVAWLSPETRKGSLELILKNLAASFAGAPLVTPIPEGA